MITDQTIYTSVKKITIYVSLLLVIGLCIYFIYTALLNIFTPVVIHTVSYVDNTKITEEQIFEELETNTADVTEKEMFSMLLSQVKKNDSFDTEDRMKVLEELNKK